MTQTTRKKTKEERVRGEYLRLRKIYKDLPEDQWKMAMSLIERASFMRVELEDLEADLSENGWTETFRQSEKVEPYERARPAGQTYNTVNANYQKLMKQLSDLLPKKPVTTETDPFDAFLSERDQM